MNNTAMEPAPPSPQPVWSFGHPLRSGLPVISAPDFIRLVNGKGAGTNPCQSHASAFEFRIFVGPLSALQSPKGLFDLSHTRSPSPPPLLHS